MTPNKYLITALAFLLATQAPAAEEEKEEWNVNAPPGDSRTIPIDTHTGTWMSLDVWQPSPETCGKSPTLNQALACNLITRHKVSLR